MEIGEVMKEGFAKIFPSSGLGGMGVGQVGGDCLANWKVLRSG